MYCFVINEDYIQYTIKINALKMYELVPILGSQAARPEGNKFVLGAET